MYLTREEEKMLEGEYGPAKSKAMEVLVKVGEAVGAERMIRIKHAHVSGASYLTIGEAGRRFLEEMASMGAKFSVPVTVNPISYDAESPEAIPLTRISRDIVEGQEAIIRALSLMGAELKMTCTPYYTDIPSKLGLARGDHVAWGESSAVAYANSVLGIWTNREGGPLALMAGIAGRTYYYGPHDSEWRRPKTGYRVKIERPLDSAEAGVLGYMIARIHREEGPPLVDAWIGGEGPLKEFLAAIGTASSLPMAHITGVTPEAPPSRLYEVVEIGAEDLDMEMERLSPPGRPDLIYVGCPHSSLEEVRELARHLEMRGGVKAEVVVSLSRDLYLKALREGLVERLKGFGVKFVRDTCLIVSPFSKFAGDIVIATNSYKAYYYLAKRGLRVGVARISDMVELSR